MHQVSYYDINSTCDYIVYGIVYRLGIARAPEFTIEGATSPAE